MLTCLDGVNGAATEIVLEGFPIGSSRIAGGGCPWGFGSPGGKAGVLDRDTSRDISPYLMGESSGTLSDTKASTLCKMLSSKVESSKQC